jgi:hypothetical protein
MPMMSEAFTLYGKRMNQRLGMAVLKNGYHRVSNHVEFSLVFLDPDCIQVLTLSVWLLDLNFAAATS